MVSILELNAFCSKLVQPQYAGYSVEFTGFSRFSGNIGLYGYLNAERNFGDGRTGSFTSKALIEAFSNMEDERPDRVFPIAERKMREAQARLHRNIDASNQVRADIEHFRNRTGPWAGVSPHRESFYPAETPKLTSALEFPTERKITVK